MGLVIDTPFLYRAAKEKLGGNVSYACLYKKIQDCCGMVTHAVCHLKKINGQKRFVEALFRSGFSTNVLSIPNDSPEWTAHFAGTILNIAPHVDHIVVATADPLILPILEFVEGNWDCKVTVLGFKDLTDPEVTEFAGDAFIEVDESLVHIPKQPFA